MIDSFIINVLKINDSVSDLPLSLLKKAISLNHTEIGYYTGYLLFEVVQVVFPVGLIVKSASSVAKVSKFGDLLKLGDKFSDLNKAADRYKRKKDEKSIVHAGISRTEIQAFLDFLKILSEKLRMKTEGFVNWLDEIFEGLKKWLDELFGKAEKIDAKSFNKFRKKYPTILKKGDRRISKEYYSELKNIEKDVLSKAFQDLAEAKHIKYLKTSKAR